MAGRDDVRVIIGGDAKGLKSALADAQGLTSRFAVNMKSVLGPVAGSFASVLSSVFSVRGAIATLAGTGGIGLLLTSSLQAADAVAKMADRTGLSTAAVQEFGHAFKQAGVEMETFEAGVTFMNRQIGAGKTAYRDAETGILSVAEQLSQTGVAADRTRIAVAAFGRAAGPDMIPGLLEGAAGLEKMRREAREMGLVLDEAAIRNAEKAADQLELLGDVLKTNVTRALIELAPVIQSVGGELVDLGVKALAAFEVFRDYENRSANRIRYEIEGQREVLALLKEQREFAASFEGFENPVAKLDQEIRRTTEIIGVLEARLAFLQGPPVETGATGGIVDLGSAADEAAKKVGALVSALNFELDQLGRTKIEAELYAKAKAAGVDVTDSFRATVEPLIATLAAEKDALAASTEEQKQHAAALADMASRARSIFEATRTRLEHYTTAVANLSDLARAGAIDWDTYGRAVAKAQTDLDDAAEKTEKVDDAAKDLGLTFSSAFEDALVKGASLRDVLQGILDDILRIAARKAVTEPLAGLFSGIFDNLFQGSGAGAGYTSAQFSSARGNVFARSVLAGPVVPHGRGGVLTSPIAFPMADGRTGTAAESEWEAVMPLARDGRGRLGVRAQGGGDDGSQVTFNLFDQRAASAPAIERRESRGADGQRQVDMYIRDRIKAEIGGGEIDAVFGASFGLRRGGAVSR